MTSYRKLLLRWKTSFLASVMKGATCSRACTSANTRSSSAIRTSNNYRVNDIIINHSPPNRRTLLLYYVWFILTFNFLANTFYGCAATRCVTPHQSSTHTTHGNLTHILSCPCINSWENTIQYLPVLTGRKSRDTPTSSRPRGFVLRSRCQSCMCKCAPSGGYRPRAERKLCWIYGPHFATQTPYCINSSAHHLLIYRWFVFHSVYLQAKRIRLRLWIVWLFLLSTCRNVVVIRSNTFHQIK